MNVWAQKMALYEMPLTQVRTTNWTGNEQMQMWGRDNKKVHSKIRRKNK
jgi:hypothetical protein